MTVDLFALRSLLFLPASRAGAIVKARAVGADLVILDLEDAVKPEDKDAARDAAVQAVSDPWPMPVAVRVNRFASLWHDEDLAAVMASESDIIVIPDLRDAQLLAGIRERTSKPVIAMIESAEGVLRAPEIARECSALMLGTNDLANDLRLPRPGARAALRTALQSVVLAARAIGIAVFDGVFNALEDEEGLLAECSEACAYGFDGKSLIHPRQIPLCHRAFAPPEAEISRARRLIAAATGGAERFEGEMIETMHVQAARRLLARAP